MPGLRSRRSAGSSRLRISTAAAAVEQPRLGREVVVRRRRGSRGGPSRSWCSRRPRTAPRRPGPSPARGWTPPSPPRSRRAPAPAANSACRSVASGRGPHAVDHQVAEPGLDRADQAGDVAGRAQPGLDQVGGRGLAGGAGDADDGQPRRSGRRRSAAATAPSTARGSSTTSTGSAGARSAAVGARPGRSAPPPRRRPAPRRRTRRRAGARRAAPRTGRPAGPRRCRGSRR